MLAVQTGREANHKRSFLPLQRFIIFTDEMLGLTRLGLKSETRRVMNFAPPNWTESVRFIGDGTNDQQKRLWAGFGDPLLLQRNVPDEALILPENTRTETWRELCPYGYKGHLLNIKENLKNRGGKIIYSSDSAAPGDWLPQQWQWKRDFLSSRYMPHDYSRDRIEVEEIGAERLHAITPEGVRREGVEGAAAGYYLDPFTKIVHTDGIAGTCLCKASPRLPAHKCCYRAIWSKIHSPESWEANPWIWRIRYSFLRG